MGSECKLASQINLGSEHSFINEPQDPATSSRILLPLEPDFSQMSDPSVVIERHSSKIRLSRKDQP